MTRRLEASTEVQDSMAAFLSVFQNADPFDRPFQEQIKSRGLLYPLGYALEPGEFRAVAKAALSVDDRIAYLSEVEGFSGKGWAERGHWEIDLRSYPYSMLAQQGFVAIAENALYSPRGTWGLLISHEQHAVVGGPEEFIRALQRSFPGHRDQVAEFLAFWNDNKGRFGSEIRWLPHLMDHLYGPSEAARLLRRYQGNGRT